MVLYITENYFIQTKAEKNIKLIEQLLLFIFKYITLYIYIYDDFTVNILF